jgi:hypothetical protein
LGIAVQKNCMRPKSLLVAQMPALVMHHENDERVSTTPDNALAIDLFLTAHPGKR